MKTRQILKILLVIAGASYLIHRSWGALTQLAHDGASLFGFILLIGLLTLAIVRVIRA